MGQRAGGVGTAFEPPRFRNRKIPAGLYQLQHDGSHDGMMETSVRIQQCPGRITAGVRPIGSNRDVEARQPNTRIANEISGQDAALVGDPKNPSRLLSALTKIRNAKQKTTHADAGKNVAPVRVPAAINWHAIVPTKAKCFKTRVLASSFPRYGRCVRLSHRSGHSTGSQRASLRFGPARDLVL